MHKKIKTLGEISEIILNEKRKGHKIVQCHGVFDLLHPGHIRHFEEAKKQGDCLVVTVTPDRYVNKGPGRPAFNEVLRLESLASLTTIDYVVLNDEPTAVGAIYSVKPNIYVKGKEYKDFSNDLTGKINEETQAVERNGGQVYFTDDIVFSSSSLINEHIENFTPEKKNFLSSFKSKHTAESFISKINSLKNSKVVVLGDAIIDIYQYIEPLGQTGKGLHMSVVCKEQEVFLGGSLIIANHLADFVEEVHLITSIGYDCEHSEFVRKNLKSNVTTDFIYSNQKNTLSKKRYVSLDGNVLSKLFETYSSNVNILSAEGKAELIRKINSISNSYDLILVSDFGNGLIDENTATQISKTSNFLAINTQTNSGNRGFNVISKYQRANYVALNEPELRLATHDRYSDVKDLINKISTLIDCSQYSITSGVRGIKSFTNSNESAYVPALSLSGIDRVGAGDSYLALSALALSNDWTIDEASFFGAVAAALDIQIIGNKESINKVPLCKFITRLLK